MYIRMVPDENGNHGAPCSNAYDGAVMLPDELLQAYLQAKGFAIIDAENGVVTSVETNQDALLAYIAGLPEEETQEKTLEERVQELTEKVNALMGGGTDESTGT